MDIQHFYKQNDVSKNIFTVINVLSEHIWLVCLIGRMSSAILVVIRSSFSRVYRPQTRAKKFSKAAFTQAVKAG